MNAFMGGRTTKLGPIPQSAQNYIWFYRKDSRSGGPQSCGCCWTKMSEALNDGFFVTDSDGPRMARFFGVSAHRHNYSSADFCRRPSKRYGRAPIRARAR